MTYRTYVAYRHMTYGFEVFYHLLPPISYLNRIGRMWRYMAYMAYMAYRHMTYRTYVGDWVSIARPRVDARPSVVDLDVCPCHIIVNICHIIMHTCHIIMHTLA